MERDVATLNEIMRDMSTLVHAGAEPLATVEGQVQESARQAKEAVEHLAEAERVAAATRRRKAWAVLVAVAVIVCTVGIATPFVVARLR